MPKAAAIDIGSNGVRMIIGRLNAENRIEILFSTREALRLGADVFVSRTISQDLLQRAVEIFRRFKSQMEQLGVVRARAVATSALREAHNRDEFFDAVRAATGIEVELISGEEEARLVHAAVADAVPLRKKTALLIDIGGGSVEMTVASRGGILATDSYKMGTVRLLQMLGGDRRRKNARFRRMVEEYVKATRRRVRKEVGRQSIDLLIGTGGNCEALGVLGAELLGRKSPELLRARDLDKLVDVLTSMSYSQRVAILRLRPDRADVIVPAAIVLRTVMRILKVKTLRLPNVGLKNGVLLDMIDDLHHRKSNLHYDEVMEAAVRLGRKFDVDPTHAGAVAGFSGLLFDALRERHGLDDENRMILEVAARLHETGMFLSPIGYHKHTYYILKNNPLLGLNREQMAAVAHVARFSRKSLPKKSHAEFDLLPSARREAVNKLIPLLRLAKALDEERAGAVVDLKIDVDKKRILLKLKGRGDLYLETWALAKQSQVVQEIYGVPLEVERTRMRAAARAEV